MKLCIDRKIYSDSVFSKAVYWLAGDYKIVRHQLDANTEEIEATPKSNSSNAFEERLFDALNDFKLRQIIADETRDIKTILYAKAFAEDEDLCEEDIHD